MLKPSQNGKTALKAETLFLGPCFMPCSIFPRTNLTKIFLIYKPLGLKKLFLSVSVKLVLNLVSYVKSKLSL